MTEKDNRNESLVYLGVGQYLEKHPSQGNVRKKDYYGVTRDFVKYLPLSKEFAQDTLTELVRDEIESAKDIETLEEIKSKLRLAEHLGLEIRGYQSQIQSMIDKMQPKSQSLPTSDSKRPTEEIYCNA